MCRSLTKRWHDVRVRKLVLVSASIVFLFASPQTSLANQTSTSDTIPDTSAPSVYDLENEPSQCIGLLPRPGCGKEPQDAGERGGALQYAVFGLMILGLGVIGSGMVRGIKKQKPQL